MKTLRTTLLMAALLGGWAATAFSYPIVSRLSPRAGERPRRAETRFIILHTTEAPAGSALRKLCENGEAHYLVNAGGGVYRLMPHDRVAYHAGLSMWEGRTQLDLCSIGIEVEGYHNRPITAAQYASVRRLLAELKGIYRVPDTRVLTHCMVAYGRPNRWHRKPHRGRKLCGMQFARDDVRARLGLKARPLFDPDVRAGRLIAADPDLARALYGTVRQQQAASGRYGAEAGTVIVKGRTAWDVARDRYNAAGTWYVYPDGRTVRGDRVTQWDSMPVGTRVVFAEPVQAAAAATERPARPAEAAGTTPSGYTHAGDISARRSAFDLCGPRWNKADTLYRFPDGRGMPGNRVREGAIPPGTAVYLPE